MDSVEYFAMHLDFVKVCMPLFSEKQADLMSDPTSDGSKSTVVDIGSITGLLKKQDEWKNAVVFDESGNIIGGTIDPLTGELK